MSGGTVMVVEDHRMVADNLAIVLRSRGYDVRVVEDLDAEHVITEAERVRPDAVLLDLQLAGCGDGLHLVAPLSDGGARVVMLTGVTDRRQLAECVERGAAAVASKASSFDSVVEKVESVLAGGPGFRPAEREALLADLRLARAEEDERLAPFRQLSPRERSVLALLMRGLQADAIAETAFVGVATVRTQIRSILLKLGVSSQLTAVAMARAAGWTDADD